MDPHSDICPECSAPVAGGQAGCQFLWDALAAQALSNPDYTAAHTLAFDTYCMQHIEPYCHSAKSYAAHLTRLCCGLEYGGQPEVYAALQRWLNGAAKAEKPAVLSHRGHITLVAIYGAPTPEEHARRVRAWAEDVWTAYTAQQALARLWLQAALNAKKTDASPHR